VYIQFLVTATLFICQELLAAPGSSFHVVGVIKGVLFSKKNLKKIFSKKSEF